MRVLLVCMPFVSVERPTLSVSLLKAELLAAGVDCDVLYLSVAFAEILGRRSYDLIAEHLPHKMLAGEWVFADCLHDDGRGFNDGYVDEILRKQWRAREQDIDVVLQARAEAPRLLEDAVTGVAWGEYDVVGFSSSNAQNLASLALAQRVRLHFPSVTILFGGANWQGGMGVELLRHFPFVDMAFTGEADLTLPEFARRFAVGNDDVNDLPGMAYRRRGKVMVTAPAPPVEDLDALPTPDHSDFFSALRRAPRARMSLPAVPLETTRGCSWGQRRPCGFCGLDDAERVYRTKSPVRIFRELRELGRTWRGSRLFIVDNVVSPAFLAEVLPALFDEPLPMPLFFDVRPDVSRDAVTLMGRLHAHVQPGLESFSDHVLRLMGKGTRALENVRLLKWCRESGVTLHWNLVYGVPGETTRDYDEMLALLPSIRFLCPPSGCGPISLDRYSPFFEASEEHGFREIRPLPAYEFIYRLPERDLRRIAYSFTYSCDPPAVDRQRAGRIHDEVAAWERDHTEGGLWYDIDDGTCLRLKDERPVISEGTPVLSGIDRVLYLGSEQIASRSALHAAAHQCERKSEVDERLDVLCRRRLMVSDGERFLSLALRRSGRSATIN